jgi:hypothetical protein
VAHPEGIDPEVSGEMDFYHHYLEIIQALALYGERNYSVKPLMNEAIRLREEMKAIGDLMGLRWLNIPPALEKIEELKAYQLRTDMMLHTTAVRNWAYFHQMKKIVLDLCKLLGDHFKAVYGIDAFDLMDLLFRLAAEREELLNEHRNRVRSFIRKKNTQRMMEAYNAAFPQNKKIDESEFERLWQMAGKNKQNLRGMFIMHSDLKLDKIYSFTLDHAATLLSDQYPRDILKDVLSRLTYDFGDLSTHQPEHIILDNPTHHSIDTLSIGVGYWLRFASPTIDTLTGEIIKMDTIFVNAGWNLIGTIRTAIPVDSIRSVPRGLVTSRFFGYEGGYVISDTIRPGHGYWVKVSDGGELILISMTQLSATREVKVPSDRIRIVSTEELPPSPPDKNPALERGIAKYYALGQAYPNPFNQSTTIQYQLPSDSRGSLRIYNLLGQVVSTLVDQTESAGYKQVNWNASSFASGIYFYRLEATRVADPSKVFTQVKKAVLIK